MHPLRNCSYLLLGVGNCRFAGGAAGRELEHRGEMETFPSKTSSAGDEGKSSSEEETWGNLAAKSKAGTKIQEQKSLNQPRKKVWSLGFFLSESGLNV